MILDKSSDAKPVSARACALNKPLATTQIQTKRLHNAQKNVSQSLTNGPGLFEKSDSESQITSQNASLLSTFSNISRHLESYILIQIAIIKATEEAGVNSPYSTQRLVQFVRRWKIAAAAQFEEEVLERFAKKILQRIKISPLGTSISSALTYLAYYAVNYIGPKD